MKLCFYRGAKLLGFAMAVVVARKRHGIRRLVGKSAIVRKGLQRSFFFSFSRRLTNPLRCHCTLFSRRETRESIRRERRCTLPIYINRLREIDGGTQPKESSGRKAEIEGRYIAAQSVFYRGSRYGDGKGKERIGQTRNAPLGESEYPHAEFPSRKSPYPPTSILVLPQTGMKYLFAYASLGPAAVSELPARSPRPQGPTNSGAQGASVIHCACTVPYCAAAGACNTGICFARIDVLAEYDV
ncbi:hypothetical protein ALC56_12820 [Trachymyrmex septentrionalis]|uniref:Uncharacterized protein n=1 Tax=Trachymyrmex septentrionalis TaxID=34720 RepID=A0A195EY88_9HYME|nr:hypothetical protein ALC56_12820 [Trachymyrmex septentrionalis]